jgi:hypothetical protein
MLGCILQKYGNSPAEVNLWEYVLDGLIRDVKPESNTCPTLGVLGTPDVTVCMLLSSLVQIIVLPTFTKHQREVQELFQV